MNHFPGTVWPYSGVQLAETGFDVRSRRRNRPQAGTATSSCRCWATLARLRCAVDGYHLSLRGEIMGVRTSEVTAVFRSHLPGTGRAVPGLTGLSDAVYQSLFQPSVHTMET